MKKIRLEIEKTFQKSFTIPISDEQYHKLLSGHSIHEVEPKLMSNAQLYALTIAKADKTEAGVRVIIPK